MANSPYAHDKGTRFTNYSSIHSVDAFVGDYQVMYTPGSTSPQFNKGSRKPSRFSRVVSTSKPQNNNQSYLLPSNMPNTSQIMPDHGILPNIQVHYNIPADEKQIVASLRSLQRDLAEAMQTINELTRERDEAMHELRLLRATSRKPSSPVKKQNIAVRVEEELFDLSRSEESLKRSVPRGSSNKKVAIEKQATASDNARVLSTIPINTVSNQQVDKRSMSRTAGEEHKYHKNIIIDDTEQSIAAEDPTAASNTSRRRRRPSLDDNMTSAYILPDIIQQQPQVSREAQNVLHSLEPEHVTNCEVCRRLTTTTTKPKSSQTQKPTQVQQKHHHHQPAAKIDYTAQIAGFNIDESFAQDPTMRPKIAPGQALARVRGLMNAQFLRAKERHHEAWLKYDSFEAPLSSRKHAQVGKEMSHWAEKMEECRVHLDYLRDVEEGMDEVA